MKRVVNLVSVLILVCIVSLILSYFVTTSSAWEWKFGGTRGFFVEAFRALIAVPAGLMLVLRVFSVENRIIFGSRQSTTPVPSSRIMTCRLIGLSMGIFTLTMLVMHHFIWGPSELRTAYLVEHVVGRESNYVMFYRPYLMYFPYSFIIFMILGVWLFVVGVLSLWNDFDVVAKARSQVIVALDRLHTDFQGLLSDFGLFTVGYLKQAERLNQFLIAMSIFVISEYLFGRTTLTTTAFRFTNAAFIVASIAIFIVVIVFAFYQDTFKVVLDKMESLGMLAEAKKFEAEQNAQEFLKRFFRRNIFAYMAIIGITALFGGMKLVLDFMLP